MQYCCVKGQYNRVTACKVKGCVSAYLALPTTISHTSSGDRVHLKDSCYDLQHAKLFHRCSQCALFFEACAKSPGQGNVCEGEVSSVVPGYSFDPLSRSDSRDCLFRLEGLIRVTLRSSSSQDKDPQEDPSNNKQQTKQHHNTTTSQRMAAASQQTSDTL